jgi:glyoxylase-like metal-dependent hydrolase (beta-lactamase superfamily II)
MAPDFALQILDGGMLTLTHGMVFLRGRPEPHSIPIPSYLIRHPKGNVLYDGGMQEEATDPRSYYGDGFTDVMKPQLAAEQHVIAQLESLDVDPASIRYVIESHLHFDHVGAVGHLPAAQFLVQRRELAYAYDPHWFVDGYHRADFDRPEVDWELLDLDEERPELDLYGDGTLRLVHTPGHAVGMTSLLVNLEGGPILIAGDAAHTETHYNHKALPGLYLDAPAYVRSLERLHRLQEESGAELVLYGHDIEQWQTLKKGHDAYR